jgi:hypothetical protein
MLRNLTPAQLAKLYVPMLDGLKKAQLVEADEILNGDPSIKARQRGLISETVGESSQFYRQGMPLDLPIAPAAMKYLQRWVRFGARIARS